MNSVLRSFLPLALAALLGAAPASAQCPVNDFDGDEPADFTHYVDDDGDGICERLADETNGVWPNGLYPSCTLDASLGGGTQVAHGHWEYTHRQEDELGQSEEKDYLTFTQAGEEDFTNQDPNGTRSRESFGETMRFALREPLRFDRFLRPSANPEGRYWQVDEWIGPAGSPGAAPLLTWNERFFVCGSDDSPYGTCTTVNGQAAYGGYWSDHAQQFGYQADCGEPHLADPETDTGFGRNPQCGLLFVECGTP